MARSLQDLMNAYNRELFQVQSGFETEFQPTAKVLSMNRFSKKAALLTTLVVPFTFGAMSASAAQITHWEYQVNNSFTDADFTDGDGVTEVDGGRLSWGNEEVQSELTITENISNPPLMETNGPEVAGGQFVHQNRTIPAGAPVLENFTLTSSISLQAAAPEGENADIGPLSVQFESYFTETRNQEPCFTGSASVCDDIFTLEDPDFGDIDDDGNFAVDPTTFTVGDYNYTVFLEIVGLNNLTAEQCGVAGAPASCIGFLTEEDATNEFNANFQIVSSPVSVPEPGSLALLGLGLIGLGVASRRK